MPPWCVRVHPRVLRRTHVPSQPGLGRRAEAPDGFGQTQLQAEADTLRQERQFTSRELLDSREQQQGTREVRPATRADYVLYAGEKSAGGGLNAAFNGRRAL
jgi:hypothetical protein